MTRVMPSLSPPSSVYTMCRTSHRMTMAMPSISTLFLSFLLHLAASVEAQSGGSVLQLLAPLKTGFTEFVDSSESTSFTGFSIQVFQAAIARLSSPPAYKLIGYGDGKETPLYDEMLRLVQEKKVDGVVGDVTITRERMELVDFTQPYAQSALAVVIPARFAYQGSMWEFLRPFSWELWIAIATAFLSTGMVMLVLERHNTDFEGPQLKRFLDVYWFICLSIFFCQRERVHTQLGRLVLALWLIVVLIFTSSYTANLTSSLTVQHLSSHIKDLESLRAWDVRVGYQEGSFTSGYLQHQGFAASRLIPLNTETDYAEALRKGPGEAGGVAAIVDELPYVTEFVANKCDYTSVGDPSVYFGGLAYAFRKNSSLTEEMSMGILSIAQDGTLQAMHNGWLGVNTCNLQTKENHMGFKNFGGLFMILGGMYGISALWRSGRTIWLVASKFLLFLMHVLATFVAFVWPRERKEAQGNPIEMGMHVAPELT